MSAPLLELPGAVIGVGQRVAVHYGRPFAEELKLRAGRAFTDLSLFEVVSVSGKDRLNWLHNLTTQDFKNLQPGESSEMLVLDPFGHIQAAAGVIDDGATTWLISDQGVSGALAKFLESMKFMLDVAVDVPDFGVLGVMCTAGALPQKCASWRS